jgi:hypothetical protein
MSNLKPCKHGCGQEVSVEDIKCPNCGGARPHPDAKEVGKPGLIERGCLIVMLVGGVVGAILLILTKLAVG